MALTLTINGKDYGFKFGLRFVHKMNTVHEVAEDGIKFAIGLQVTLSKWLGNNDPDALLTILTTANEVAGGAKVKSDDLADYLDDLTADEFDGFKESLVEELRHSNFAKGPTAMIEERLKAQADKEAQTKTKG